MSFRKISDDIVTADQRRENIGRKVRNHADLLMRMWNSWFILYMRPQKVDSILIWLIQKKAVKIRL